jgi:hypothetical protein
MLIFIVIGEECVRRKAASILHSSGLRHESMLNLNIPHKTGERLREKREAQIIESSSFGQLSGIGQRRYFLCIVVQYIFTIIVSNVSIFNDYSISLYERC